MVDDLLADGVTALCQVDPEAFNQAHWGAAVVAACLLAEDPLLEPAAAQPMLAQATRMRTEMARFFPPRTPSRRADPGGVAQLVANHAGRLSVLGHDVIFSALALTAMARHSELATTANVEGLAALVSSIQAQGPGGPFPGWDDPSLVSPGAEIPSLIDNADLARASLDAFSSTGPVYAGLDQGTVIHVLTHAHAITLFDDLGYEAAGSAARRAQRVYIQLLTRRPSSGTPLAPGDHLDPRTCDFWNKDQRGRGLWLFGHTFKLPLALFRLSELAGGDSDERWYRHASYILSAP